MNIKRNIVDKYDLITNNIVEKIQKIEDSEGVLKNEFKKLDDVEAVYLIDCKDSKQINNTIMGKIIDDKFKATKHNDEHYLKEYFYITLESKQGSFLSQKYISGATGNICKTYAKKFEIDETTSCILCLDIRIERA